MKKAPNPREYWQQQAELLAADAALDVATLYTELLSFDFQPWSASSIGYQKELGARLVKRLGNPYNYAASTFVSALRNAALQRERARRNQSAKTKAEG